MLIDVGPNLDMLNRAALLAAEDVVIPRVPDLYSLQGLRNLGPILRCWQSEWRERLERWPDTLADLQIPGGEMQPTGYVVFQHAARLDRPVQAYGRWMARIPQEHRHSVLDETASGTATIDADPSCIATLKHYRSLMPLAQEAHKPIFLPQARRRRHRWSYGGRAGLLPRFSRPGQTHRRALRDSDAVKRSKRIE